jgi:4-amino-4-deoxy-L-arabinose transferase-like glycosyltransferase
VQTLLDGKGFPVFRPGQAETGEHYEDHQPPLYYLATAGFAKVVGVANVADPGAARLRWLNALVGGLTVLGVFYLGLWGIGKADVALGAAAITAALPMLCALDGAISNDPLLFSLCTWTLAVSALALRQGWTMKLALIAGALTGLAILTKTTAVALLPILLLAIVLPQKKRPSLAMIGAALGVLAVVALPWLVRNQRLYGDPLAQKVFNQAFTGSPSPAVATLGDTLRNDPELLERFARFQESHPELKGADLMKAADRELGVHTAKSPNYWMNWVGWWTARSFFGVFGYMDIWLNESGTPYGPTPNRPAPNVVYRLLIAISAVLTIGWIGSFFQPEWKESRSVQLMNAAFWLIVAGLFVMFNLTYFQGQGRYLYPAIGPISLALSIGCFTLLGQRGKTAVSAFAGLLLLLNVYAIAKLPAEFKERTQVALVYAPADDRYAPQMARDI